MSRATLAFEFCILDLFRFLRKKSENLSLTFAEPLKEHPSPLVGEGQGEGGLNSDQSVLSTPTSL